MRIGFTIVLNGKHHLVHNNYAEYLLKDCLDYWVVIEGATKSGGSTSWCTGDNSKYHKNGSSIDGTIEYLLKLKEEYPNLIVVLANKIFSSKDEMVNVAINEIKKITDKCLLIQIDVDEQWTKGDLQENENILLAEKAKMGQIKFNHYVGKGIIAKGPNWGDNWQNRLWNWNGEYFDSHEPPALRGGNGKVIQINKACEHYSYYFEDDVRFKADWYGYGEGFFQRWKKLQTETEFPQPLSYLFGGYEGENGKIIKI